VSQKKNETLFIFEITYSDIIQFCQFLALQERGNTTS